MCASSADAFFVHERFKQTMYEVRNLQEYVEGITPAIEVSTRKHCCLLFITLWYISLTKRYTAASEE